MSATIRGAAVIWSVGTQAFTAGIVSANTGGFVQSLGLARNSENAKIKTIGGKVAAIAYHGLMKTLTLTVVPSAVAGGTSLADAQAAVDEWMPTAGTIVTLTDTEGTLVAGSYNTVSSKQNRTVDGVLTIDLELENGDEGTNLAVALTA